MVVNLSELRRDCVSECGFLERCESPMFHFWGALWHSCQVTDETVSGSPRHPWFHA